MALLFSYHSLTNDGVMTKERVLVTTKTFRMRKHLLMLIRLHAERRRFFYDRGDYVNESEHLGLRNAYLIVVNLYTKDNE